MAEIRPEEQSEEVESCQEDLQNEIQLNGPERQRQTQEQNQKEWASLGDLCQRHEPQLHHHMKASQWGLPPEVKKDWN